MSGPNEQLLKAGCEELAGRDGALAEAYAVVGIPVWRSTSASYETLARTVAYQLISTRAADAIWGRVQAYLGPDISPTSVLACDQDGLRACGMSRPKVAHMRSIAIAVESDALCFDRLRNSSTDVARDDLLAVKGIGPWTAELFLMNALGQVDAFPVGDVGVMEAYRQLSNLDRRHDAKAFMRLAEAWRPYRGVAAHLLWGWLNAQRRARSNPTLDRS